MLFEGGRDRRIGLTPLTRIDPPHASPTLGIVSSSGSGG